MTLFELMRNLLAGALVVAGIAYALVGWLDGCGEHYVDARGRVHVVECKKGNEVTFWERTF